MAVACPNARRFAFVSWDRHALLPYGERAFLLDSECGVVEEIYKEIRSIRFAQDARGLAIPSRYALLTV